MPADDTGPETTQDPQEQALTHDDLARETGVSVTTIKSYRRKFPGFIPVLGFGKPIRFAPGALAVCSAIRESFGLGLSVRETTKRLQQAGFDQDPGSVPPPGPATLDAARTSDARLDDFLRAAGAMMQSVAALAEAQQRTDQRLEHLERLMAGLAAETDRAKARQPARRVVKVRSSQGTVESYTLGNGDDLPSSEAFADAAPDALLDVPVAIQRPGGEFLGLPGRLSLRGLLDRLLAEAPESGPHAQTRAAWQRRGAAWCLNLAAAGLGDKILCFEPRTTPAGVDLAVLTRLVQSGQEATEDQRMDYFRQIKDRFAAK